MRQLLTDYRAGFTFGLITGVTSGVSVLAAVLFLLRFWV